MNKIYRSILLKLSAISPMFGKVLLDQALQKIGRSSLDVTASELVSILKNDINSQISEGATLNTILSAGAGYFITNQKDELVYANEFAEKLLEDIKKDNPQPGFSNFDYLRNLGFCRGLKELTEIEVLEIDFSQTTFNVSIAPIFNEKDVITGMISIVHDITLINELEKETLEYTQRLQDEIESRIKAEKELIENQQAMIRSSNLASLGEMGAGIAHEINNPLSVIIMNNNIISKLLRKGETDLEKIEPLLETSNRSILNISKIIKTMRNLSRKTDDMPFSPTTVRAIIDQTIPLCSQKFYNHGIQFFVDPKDPLNDTPVKCRSIELSQGLINLLNNSFDAVEDVEDKWIQIDLNKEDHNVIIDVIDSGKGVPQEVKGKIFDPFYTTKEVGKGTGLGLSITKKLLQQHGGDLFLDTQSPFTKFQMVIPIHE